jgi:hypothetical protein
MSLFALIALITWIMAAGGGLYLLSIWLIEYDKEFQASAATRLPPVVLGSHVLLAGGGLIVWAGYLVFDVDGLTWVALGALGGAAALGTVMAIRWVGVYRAGRAAAIERLEAAIWALAEERYRPSPPDWIVGWDPAVERDLAERNGLPNGRGAVNGSGAVSGAGVFGGSGVVGRAGDVGGASDVGSAGAAGRTGNARGAGAAGRTGGVRGAGAIGGCSRVAVLNRPFEVGPPERNFPLPVVIAHGFFALVTITLVLLTAVGVGGSS